MIDREHCQLSPSEGWEEQAVVVPPSGGLAEEILSGAAAALFSFAMGLSAVAVPLLALASGYHPSEVGAYIAASAVAQMATRAVMGAMMRSIPDKYFVVLAGVLMAAACAVFGAWVAWWAFLASQMLQGAARGIFWSGTQTHAIRTSRSAVAAIAKVNLASGLGLIAGPVVAGPMMARWSEPTALAVAAGVALALVVPAALMLRLPTLRPARTNEVPVAVWRRPGVGLANWSGATAGAWRALMNSYIPIILDQARQSPGVIGGLLAAANASSIVGGAVAGGIRETRLRAWLMAGVLVTGAGLVLFGLGATHALLAGAALVVSGMGVGVLQTVGPALAADSVGDDERGEAITSAGTFRAAALLAAPLAVAGLVLVVTGPAAMAIAGAALAVPTLLARRARA